jgi:arabinogalactan oligomer/maltooligosaccharide transport system substrate-binding protein
MTKILSLVLVLVMALACFSLVGCNEKKTYEITMWVSTTEGVDDLFMEQVEAFKAAHPEYNFNITIETVGEGDAATEVLKDVATAPDMYCFAQDQISRLVQGGALAPLGAQAAATVTANNDAGSVGAATVGDNIYAYPFTSDNGYYLYYDSSIVSDEDAKTLEGILAACEKAGVKFGYELTNAWIMAGFFFAQPVEGGEPLCHNTWTYSADGKTVTGVDDNFNSDNGLIAMRKMYEMASSKAWLNTSGDFAGTGALVTGIWNAGAAESVYGDNMKATKLPTYTVDGKTYQMGSFSGYKLIGCKPQADETKAKLCSDLALWLSSEEAQLERYYEFQWGPSNKAAQANEDVKGNALLSALLEQNVYSVPQGVIHGDWWNEGALLGEKCKEAGLTEADLKAALAEYEVKVNAMVAK